LTLRVWSPPTTRSFQSIKINVFQNILDMD
jgi:hypothetical protein